MNKSIIIFSLVFMLFDTGNFVSFAQTNKPVKPEEKSPEINRFYSNDGKWIKVKNKDCGVWSSWPRDNESATWDGEILDGKAHGKGTISWYIEEELTSSYKGEVKMGLSHGYGVAKKGNIEYEGSWIKGNLTTKMGFIRYGDDRSYKGGLKNGIKNGYGEETMVGGVKYIGNFDFDKFNGQGMMIYQNGDKIIGKWVNSRLEGAGTYERINGDNFKVKQTDDGFVIM